MWAWFHSPCRISHRRKKVERLKQSDQKGRFALNFKSYTLAILVHIVLLGVIMFNLFWNPTQKIEIGGGDIEPIQAQVIDESLLNQELAKLKEEDELKKQQEIEKQQNLEQLEKQAEEKKLEIERLEQAALEKKKEEQQKIEQLAEQRKLEEEKTQEAEKKRLAEEARLKELALEKEKEEEEKKKKAQELAQQKLEEERKKEEAEQKRKLEEEKKKQEELAQKQREEERRKQEEAEKLRKEKELADQLAAEQAQARSQAAALFAQYIGPIKSKVTNSWIRPATVRPGARAKVLVRVSPQGDVLTAKIQQASGDAIFDRSVINAVYKASPLPIPNDPRLYPHYRDFVFNFDPPG